MALKACPLITARNSEEGEDLRQRPQNIWAYKLSRQRWSYNCCQLDLSLDHEPVKVIRATEGTTSLLPNELQESAIAFKVELDGQQFIALHVYLVYDAAAELTSVSKDGDPQRRFEWFCVSRRECCRGCEGPLLHSVQRYGQPGGRRTGVRSLRCPSKSAEHLYISIDEAASHVGVQHFRLIFGAFSPDGTRLLGTGCSRPIRVIANNDVPRGPCTFSLRLKLSRSSANLPESALTRSCSDTCPTQLDALAQGACTRSTDKVNIRPADHREQSGAGPSRRPHSQRPTQQSLLEMINCEDGRQYALRHNAAPALLLMHACASCLTENSLVDVDNTSEETQQSLLAWDELEKQYPDQMQHVTDWWQEHSALHPEREGA